MSFRNPYERAFQACGCGPGLCLPTDLCSAFDRDVIQFGFVSVDADIKVRGREVVPQKAYKSNQDGILQTNVNDGSQITLDGEYQPRSQNLIVWNVAYPCGCPTPVNLCCCCGLESAILKDVAYSGLVTKQALGIYPRYTFAERLLKNLVPTTPNVLGKGNTPKLLNFDATFRLSHIQPLTLGDDSKYYPGLNTKEFTQVQFIANVATQNPNPVPGRNNIWRMFWFNKSEYCTHYPLSGSSGALGTGEKHYTFSSDNTAIMCYFEFKLDHTGSDVIIQFYSRVGTESTQVSSYDRLSFSSNFDASTGFYTGKIQMAASARKQWTKNGEYWSNGPSEAIIPSYLGDLTKNSCQVRFTDSAPLAITMQLLRQNAFPTHSDSDLFLATVNRRTSPRLALIRTGAESPDAWKWKSSLEPFPKNSSYRDVVFSKDGMLKTPNTIRTLVESASSNVETYEILYQYLQQTLGVTIISTTGVAIAPWYFSAKRGDRFYAGINAGNGPADVECCPNGQVVAVLSQFRVFSALPKWSKVETELDSCVATRSLDGNNSNQ